MGSSSSTSQQTINKTTDKRQVSDNGGISAQKAGVIDAGHTDQTVSANGLGVSNGSGVINLDVVPGSAFDLAAHALDTTAATLGEALKTTQANSAQVIATTQANAQTDSNQIAQQIVKIGLPVVALMFVLKGK